MNFGRSGLMQLCKTPATTWTSFRSGIRRIIQAENLSKCRNHPNNTRLVWREDSIMESGNCQSGQTFTSAYWGDRFKISSHVRHETGLPGARYISSEGGPGSCRCELQCSSPFEEAGQSLCSFRGLLCPWAHGRRIEGKSRQRRSKDWRAWNTLALCQCSKVKFCRLWRWTTTSHITSFSEMIGASSDLGVSNLIILVGFLSRRHYFSTLSPFEIFFSGLY